MLIDMKLLGQITRLWRYFSVSRKIEDYSTPYKEPNYDKKSIPSFPVLLRTNNLNQAQSTSPRSRQGTNFQAVSEQLVTLNDAKVHQTKRTYLTPSRALNTNLHIFQSSGSSTARSLSKLNLLNKQQRSNFISVSANFLPIHPLGPCKNVINALVVYVAGKLSHRSGSNAFAVGPQYLGRRLIALASI